MPALCLAAEHAWAPGSTSPAPPTTPPRSPLQHLYLEHNEIRALPPGPAWARLRLLSTDWEPLLRCTDTLRQVGGLRPARVSCAGSWLRGCRVR